MKTFEPGRNVALDDAGTHVVTPRLCFADGLLHQYWTPANWDTHAPEWRVVEEYPSPSQNPPT